MTKIPGSIVALLFSATTAFGASPAKLASQSAGDDMAVLAQHVEALAEMAKSHISDVGLANALADFQSEPWKRDANGLHLWGSTTTGMHWFDAGHPEVVGLQVDAMSDLEGRRWWEMGLKSANGEGENIFMVVFPHPETNRAARGLHTCFLLEDSQRFMCAGAFEDPA